MEHNEEEIEQLFNKLSDLKDLLTNQQTEYYQSVFIQYKTKGKLSDRQYEALKSISTEQQLQNKTSAKREKIELDPSTIEFTKGFVNEKSKKFYEDVCAYYQKNKHITKAQSIKLKAMFEFHERFQK